MLFFDTKKAPWLPNLLQKKLINHQLVYGKNVVTLLTVRKKLKTSKKNLRRWTEEIS